MNAAARSSIVKAILLLSVVFVGGLSAGLALEDTLEVLPIPGVHEDQDYDDDLEDVIDGEQRLLKRIWLGEAQKQQVVQLMATREARLEAYWTARIPDMQAIIDSSRANVRALLDPEQRRKYDEGIARLRRSPGAPRSED